MEYIKDERTKCVKRVGSAVRSQHITYLRVFVHLHKKPFPFVFFHTKLVRSFTQLVETLIASMWLWMRWRFWFSHTNTLIPFLCVTCEFSVAFCSLDRCSNNNNQVKNKIQTEYRFRYIQTTRHTRTRAYIAHTMTVECALKRCRNTVKRMYEKLTEYSGDERRATERTHTPMTGLV